MTDDILKQIKVGEVSGVQFKERILDKYDIACELVAFSKQLAWWQTCYWHKGQDW